VSALLTIRPTWRVAAPATAPLPTASSASRPAAVSTAVIAHHAQYRADA
jgi:hypothetical protein